MLPDVAEVLPTLAVVPRASRSDAEDAAFLSSAYGLTPHAWQLRVLKAWLGLKHDGSWASAVCGLAVPRQNGKNALIEMRELFGMVVLGEKFLHTAHQVKTARKAFLRIASFFENARQYPELAALVKEIRKTNGQEAIVLTNGGSVEFVARSRGSARGFTVDILVCDEAQDLTDEELAALFPTTAAAPLGNPQLIVTGTPPDPDKGETGEVFTRIRNQAIAGKNKRMCWIDFGCEGPLPNTEDRSQWALHNPSCGLDHGTTMQALEDFHSVMSPEAFAREFLGWWGDPQDLSDKVVSPEAWGAGVAPDSTAPDPLFGLDVSPMRTWAAIGVSGFREDGLCHVEVTQRGGVADHREGTGWVLPRLEQMVESFPNMRLAVAGGSAAESLVPAIESLGIKVDVVRDLGAACGFFYDQGQQLRLRHLDQAPLTTAVFAAVRRDIGDNAFVWHRRKSTTDISPLYAVTLALWLAEKERNAATSLLQNVW